MSVSAKGGVGTTKGSGATARAGLGSALGFDSGRFGASPASGSFDSGRMGPASTGLGGALSKSSRGYTAAGGLDSPSEKGQGPGLGVSFDNGRFAQNTPTAKYSAAFRGDSPSEMNGAGPGVSVAGFSSDGTSALDGYNQAAKSLQTAGLSTIGGKPAPGTTAAASMSFREAEDASLAKYNALESTLASIRQAEAQKTDPYNGLVNSRRKGNPTHANLTGMTISEVQALQDGMIAAGYPSTAVGAYQTRKDTLAMAVKSLGIDPDTTKFTKSVQDRIAAGLIDNRANQATDEDGNINPSKFANKLSKEWAGFANSSGVSSYDGFNGNKASVGFSTVKGLADGLVSNDVVGPNAFSEWNGRRPAKDDSGWADDTAPSVSLRGYGVDDSATGATTRTVDRFANKYLGRDTNQNAAATVDADPKRDLTTGEKVAAGALDVGIGMVPGIGLGASLVNGALTLAGKPTIGQAVVGSVVNGAGGTPRGTEPNSGGTRNERTPDSKPEADKTAAEKPSDPVQSFIGKYISRPTPAEKWGRTSLA
ncbi:hypothetical protein DEM27_10375 [Metarhizobium album]|uniref:Uncharacterized protein n=2 Tax=Metarhizobium album TaxID=2182425 RepID=A0A2U2DU61_9HYPH|nr:hypothetical protein DEM27_10375 [Rhizobium album]